MSKENKLTTLYKKDGQEMKVNDNSLLHALELGWSDKKPSKKLSK